MGSMEPLEYDRSRIWHPYASLKDPPPVRLAKSASGVEIELADGRRLVDAVSSWWCVAHGHNHPAIADAIRRQSEKMCHVMFGGFTHEPAVALAERLAALGYDVTPLTLPDTYVSFGKPSELREKYGIDERSVMEAIRRAT